MNEKKTMIKIGIWLKPRFEKFEKVFVFLSILGVLLKLANLNEYNFVFVIGMVALVTLYFLYAYVPIEGENLVAMDIFIKYLTCWGLSIAILGILFTIMDYSGAKTLLNNGTIVTAIVTIISIFKLQKHSELKDHYKAISIRTSIYLLVCLLLLVAPKEDLKKVFKSDDQKSEQSK